MNFLFFALVLLISEIALAFGFVALSKYYYKIQKMDGRSVAKGVAERLFITISLVNDYPHSLTLFSALKLGTRLKRKDTDDTTENSFNDFYLMGNLISVTFAILYTILFKKIFLV